MTSRALGLAGGGVLALAWGVVPALDLPPFAAHMGMHMAVVALAAPLFAWAIAGGRLDPVRRWPGVCSPIGASMIEMVLVWAWHAPALHHAARHHLGWRVLEQGGFLAAGLFLWIAAIGGDAATRRARATGGFVGLLLTAMHMTLLGALLVVAQRPLYGDHGAPGALAPIHDQQIGGALMLLMGGAAYLAGALTLAADVLRRGEARP
ncbi:MAG: cytochrome c oxidase assembly protein [Myxococcales bacterium]|nr:cytochrome c oxidase assembly protein [Myxococcales bacterium]